MHQILFDTDPGVDDAMALLYLHRHPDVDLVGITTVAGNATLDIVTRNALYLAERFGIDAPIARGAGAPLHGPLHTPPERIHGANGLGGVAIAPEPQRALDPRPAHRFIIDTVRERPGEVTIVAVGMLTNLARALEEDPGIAALVRDVVIMGGAFGIGESFGNASPVAEANIHGDPHAADIVFSTAWPVTLLGLDVTERILMRTEYLAALRDGGTPEGRFLWDVTRGYQDFHEERDQITGVYSHDPTAAVCALDESPFTFRTGPLHVVTEGLGAGHTLQKAPGRPYPPSAWDDLPPQRVAVAVDAARVLELFAAAFA